MRFVVAPAAAYIMGEDDSVDIDTEEDFSRADDILARRSVQGSSSA